MELSPARRRAAWAAILIAGLAVRIGYGLWRAPVLSPAPNPDEYSELAQSLAACGMLAQRGCAAPSAAREPAYPVYLSLWFRLLGSTHGAVVAANAVLSVVLLLCLLDFSRRVLGDETALLAGAMTAVYPPLVYYAAVPLRETATASFSVLGVWALDAARRRNSLAAYAGAGAAAALASLTNFTVLPYFLVLAPAGLLWVARRRAARGSLRGASAYALVLALFYGLWPLRNWLFFHTWIIGSLGSGGGSNLYVYQVVPQELGGTPLQAKILKADPLFTGAPPDPIARDHYFWRIAAARVVDKPLHYVRLVSWRFFWDMWRPFPRRRPYEHSHALLRLTGLLTDAWIIPVGFVGLALALAAVPEVIWPLLFVLSLDFVYSLVLTMLRYRLSLMPWLILGAAYALSRGLAALRSRD
ncbi:MAG: glycosyltransferase family 39 protein [Elusimicrobia bacterium]|nr:glycosyltransferase family 39 protein [Elusimicrobiota bacterium]